MTQLSFRLPEQQPPGRDSFDTRAAAVKGWVEQLPVGHTGETARLLFDMLCEVNRLQIPAQQRFELLGIIEQPLDMVLEALEKHYTGLPFPLPQKGVRVAHFSSKLLLELVNAYQATLNSEKKASWLFRMTHQSMWDVCIHRMIQNLQRILCNYRRIRRHAPTGVWTAVHRLYFEARKNKKQHEKVSLTTGGHTTIDSEYKQALLLSMLEPQMFRRSQLQEIESSMAYWVSHTALMTSKERPSGLVAYCIRIDKDEPQTFIADSCCNACDEEIVGFLFDLSDLNNTLQKLHDGMGESDEVRLPGGFSVSRDTIETLMQCWHLPGELRPDRVNSGKPMEVAIGMSAVHVLLGKEAKQGAGGISDQVISDRLEPLSLERDTPEEIVMIPHKDFADEEPSKSPDVWSSIFYETEIRVRTWSVDTESREVVFIPAREINYNETGNCICLEKGRVQAISVGELIGLRDPEGERMTLCSVRWLSEDDKYITLGLKRLSEEIEPILVVMHTGEKKTPIYSLMGMGTDQVPQLFLPYLPKLKQKQLFIVVDEVELPLRLLDRVGLSPTFEVYQFKVAEQIDVHPEEGRSLREVNERLHEISRMGGAKPFDREREPVEEELDFSDLWSSL